VAAFLGTDFDRVIFTGSATEANQVALSLALGNRADRHHVISSQFEHPSLAEALNHLGTDGYQVEHIPTDREGVAITAALSSILKPDKTALLALVKVHNETGVIQDVKTASSLAHTAGALLLSDCVQAAGKTPLQLDDLGADLITLSSHKIYGPKGVGAVALAPRIPLRLHAVIRGGGQEFGVRSGTENTPAIVGFGIACEMLMRDRTTAARVEILRNFIEKAIIEMWPTAEVIGSRACRVGNTSLIRFIGLSAPNLVQRLDEHGIHISTGSACHSTSRQGSVVLTAIGYPASAAHEVVRISLPMDATKSDVDELIQAFAQILPPLVSATTFGFC
jgi:cysteine desulfurase